MRFALTAKVESLGKIDQPFQVTGSDHCMVFVSANDEGLISEIRVEVPAPSYGMVLPRMDQGPDGIHRVVVPHNLYEVIAETMLQKLESFGAFWAGIKKVHWEDAKREFVPETDDERKEILVNHLQYGRTPPKPMLVSKVTIQELASLPPSYEYLIVPMAFFREGMNDYREMRFVNSYCNFYYFLEGLYCKGATKNQKIMENLKSSPQVTTAVGEAIAFLRHPANAEDFNTLKKEFSKRTWSFNVGDVIKYIVMVRGNVHHFDVDRRHVKHHPMNQRDFQATAFLIFTIAMAIYPQLVDGTKPS